MYFKTPKYIHSQFRYSLRLSFGLPQVVTPNCLKTLARLCLRPNLHVTLIMTRILCGEKINIMCSTIPNSSSTTHPPNQRPLLWKHIEVNLSQYFRILGPQIKVGPPFDHPYHRFKGVRRQPIFGVIGHVGHEN